MALVIIVIAAIALLALLAVVMHLPRRLRSRPAGSPAQLRMWRDWLDPLSRRRREQDSSNPQP